MKRYINCLMIILVILVLNACNRDDEDPDIDKSVVINEFMAINDFTASDQNGEYDDWIELFNLTSDEINLTGYYLTDSKNNLKKYKFPDGTSITGKGYLIIWADGDTLQDGLHTPYKLSSDGERIILLSPQLEILDNIEYDAQYNELAYARVPNGTGDFIWQTATFGLKND